MCVPNAVMQVSITTIIIKNEIYFTGQITLHVTQNSCNTVYPKNMVSFRYIIVNTMHKSEDSINNNKFTDRSVLKCCVLYITLAFLLHSKVIQSDKHYLCQTNSRTRKMIQVNLSLRYSNVKVNVMCKLQRAHVERRVCPFGFSWRVHKRLINRRDKTLGLGGRGWARG